MMTAPEQPDPPTSAPARRARPALRDGFSAWPSDSRWGVKSRETIWSEHLYELQGFRNPLGPDLGERVKKGGFPSPTELPQFPTLCLRLRNQKPLPSLAPQAK